MSGRKFAELLQHVVWTHQITNGDTHGQVRRKCDWTSACACRIFSDCRRGSLTAIARVIYPECHAWQTSPALESEHLPCVAIAGWDVLRRGRLPFPFPHQTL